MSPPLTPIVVLAGIASHTVSNSATNVRVTSSFQATSGLSQFWVHRQVLSQAIYRLALKRLQPLRWHLEESQTGRVGDRQLDHRFNHLGALSKNDVSCTKNRVFQAWLKRALVSISLAVGHPNCRHLLADWLISDERRWNPLIPSQRSQGSLFNAFSLLLDSTPLFNCPCCRRAVHEISSSH